MMAQNLDDLASVSLPTFGHFLDKGFCGPEIKLVTPTPLMVGIAATVRVVGNDASTINDALARLQPGQVLVIEMEGEGRHAPIGAVTRARAAAEGAAGIVVGGPVTDIADLRSPDPDGRVVPIYATGTTCLTTKLHHEARGEHGIDIVVGGTTVHAGDVVLGDANGVLALPEAQLREVLAQARASDAAEPALLEEIRRQGGRAE